MSPESRQAARAEQAPEPEAGPPEPVLRLRASRDPSSRFVIDVDSLVLGKGEFVPTTEIWKGADGYGTRERLDATMRVGTAAAVWRPLRRLLESEVPDRAAIDDEEVGELLDWAGDRLLMAGVQVDWEGDLEMPLGSRVAVGSSGAMQKSVADVFRDGDSQAFHWQILLDGEPLGRDDRLTVGWAAQPVVELGGRKILVPPNIARKARNPDLDALGAIDALSIVLTGSTTIDGEIVSVSVEGWLSELRDEIASSGNDHDWRDPKGLGTELRGYQKQGVAWLERMTALGLGGCLADDMGLGKTVMLIALHLSRRNRKVSGGPTLVICPTTIIPNWEREIRRFAPEEVVGRFHGPGRELPESDEGFVITSFGTLRTDVAVLSGVDWGMIAVDEAQHVKNPSAATSKALRALPARSRVALTGTPIENELSELWSILDWTTPGLLGSREAFRRNWIRTVESERDPDAAERLSRLVGPFVLRRKKSDPGVAPELPPKIITEHPVDLTPEQARLYEDTLATSLSEIATSEGMGRRGMVLALLTELKQICNHPSQFLDKDDGPIEGRSGKLALLEEIVDTVISEEGACLVFTQYVAMGKIIARRLDEIGVGHRFLHGGTASSSRQGMIDSFQAGEFPVFILSLKAGGTGVNLTRADHVIHYDQWWNPAVEDQATDRAHRIGREDPVQVHRLVSEGTLEERILEIHASKRELSEAIIGTGEAALTELGDQELRELLALRVPGK